MRLRTIALTAGFCGWVGAQTAPSSAAAWEDIRADSLRGHVEFLASDLLEGRDTPSHGLDIAAAYIAAQFRRAGLEPAGNDGYYHTSEWMYRQASAEGVVVELAGGSARWVAAAGQAFALAGEDLDVEAEPVLVTGAETPADAAGKVLIWRAGMEENRAGRVLSRLQGARPRVVVVVTPSLAGLGRVTGRRPFRPGRAPAVPVPVVIVMDPDFARVLENPPAPLRVRVRAPRTPLRPFTMRNVVGKLEGSDPKLAATYWVVSAHHDHLGALAAGTGDRIYNGANDDASGAAALLETAGSLARRAARPRRSILFVSFAGEEKGLLGSREFVRAPPIEIGAIVGNLNLEVLGRTDTFETPHRNRLTVTGFDFTTIGPRLADLGKAEGVEFYRHERWSDPYFSQADNLAFAEKGIPAVTVSNGFMYPGYHEPDDEADRIDYDNLARLTRALAAAVMSLADSEEVPAWNETNPKTERYRRK